MFDPNKMQITGDQFVNMVKDKANNHYISLMDRIGVTALFALIEYHFFNPNTPSQNNDLFDIHFINWNGIFWMIYTIPKDFASTVEKYADIIHMRITDAMPVMLGGPAEVSKFPGFDEAEKERMNVYTVENTRHSLMYTNRHDLLEKTREREEKIVNGLFMLGPKLTAEEIRDYLWGVSEATKQ